MSAIAAILARDGRPVSSAEISDLVGSMHRRGPDAAGVWAHNHVALGASVLATLPQDQMAQPARDRESGSVLVLDGRLDAREDLAAIGAVPASELTSLNDATLLLRAYQRGGREVFARLLGDYAFALWDLPRRQLICGRDVLGLRPLFYAVTPDLCIVASELQAVLGGREATPNPGMVAEALAGLITSRTETLCANVLRVAPGSLLIIDRATVTIEEVARLDIPATLRYARESDYFDHFREVLSLAVRDRLRSAGPVGVMLSGGVDSSTVYAAARRESDVNAYIVSYDDPYYDETPVARATVAMNGGELRSVGVAAADYDYCAEIERFRDLPTAPTGANGAALRRTAVADGVRVLLNGVGGDEWFFGDTGRWTDWLLSAQWPLLYRELKSWRTGADPASWRDLLRMTVQPLIPQLLRRHSGAAQRVQRRLPWVSANLQHQVNLVERLRDAPAQSGSTHAVTGMIQSMLHGGTVAALEDQDRLGARHQHDERMPYLDRRVISFSMALPETLRSRPGCPKYITRQAWAASLPEAVLHRPEPADYTLHIVDALEAVGGAERFRALAIAEQGWVDADVVQAMSAKLFATARQSRLHIRYAQPLWSVFSVDQWYCAALSQRAPPLRRATQLPVD